MLIWKWRPDLNVQLKQKKTKLENTFLKKLESNIGDWILAGQRCLTGLRRLRSELKLTSIDYTRQEKSINVSFKSRRIEKGLEIEKGTD